jgi:MFS family permease
MQSMPAPSVVESPALSAAVARVRSRVVPYMMLLYVVSFLDRANISFAKQAMQTSVGISEQTYALAAGLFFVSYSLCGFPSNLILHRIGAKRWLSFLLVGWGLASMATMFVTSSASFYVLRIFLGILEAGFFPGAVLYLTYWFPGRVRAEIMGLFYLGVPISLIVGGPLSGLLLDLHSFAGLLGWQTMFLVEGSFAVVLGICSFWFLEDKPADARWLPEDEKNALTECLTHEERSRRQESPAQLLRVFRDPRVLRFVLIYALIQMSTYGAIFYLPSEVARLLHRSAGLMVGAVSAIPWLCALAAVYYLPRYADRKLVHRNLAAWILVAAGGASFVFPAAGPYPALIALSIAVSGFIAVQPIFWTFPTGYLADRAAAGGIALIGTGNLGGFLAPNVKVWTDEFFASSHAGFYLLAALTVANALLIATLPSSRGGRAH